MSKSKTKTNSSVVNEVVAVFVKVAPLAHTGAAFVHT